MRGRGGAPPPSLPSLGQDPLQLLVHMYVCTPSPISPISLNIANMLAKIPVLCTEFHVGIRRTPPRNGGHIGGNAPPQEQIPPPKSRTLVLKGSEHLYGVHFLRTPVKLPLYSASPAIPNPNPNHIYTLHFIRACDLVVIHNELRFGGWQLR